MEVNPGVPLGSFDLVFSIYGLGWTTDLLVTLSLVTDYLRPGGVFIVSGEHPAYSRIEWDVGTGHRDIGTGDSARKGTGNGEPGLLTAALFPVPCSQQRPSPDVPMSPVPSLYSFLSATIGSTPAARRAGTQLATTAARPSATAAPPNATTSVGGTP